jgi:hypothetical protein
MLPEISAATIVLVGKFNISDFLPKTMIENGVITEQDIPDLVWNTYVPSQKLDLELLWGQIIVTTHQLQVKAKDTPHIAASDFVRSAMGFVSEEVKVVAMGVNLEGHFKFEFPYQRDKIGVKLVPPTAWGKWGEEVQQQIETAVDPKEHGGVVNVTMRKLRVGEKDMHGFTDVRVQASPSFPDTGIYITVNDHFQIDNKGKLFTVEDLMRSDIVDRKAELMHVLESRFDAIVGASFKIMDGILEG